MCTDYDNSIGGYQNLYHIFVCGVQKSPQHGVTNKRIYSFMRTLETSSRFAVDLAYQLRAPRSRRRIDVLISLLRNVIRTTSSVLRLVHKRPSFRRGEVNRVLLCTSGPYYYLAPLVAIGRLTRLPVVIDFRDPLFLPGADAHSGAARSSVFSRFVRKHYQRFLILESSLTIVTTADIKRELLGYYPTVSEDAIQVVPNGYDDQIPFEEPEPSTTPGLTFGIVGKFAYYRPDDFVSLVAWCQQYSEIKKVDIKVNIYGDNVPSGCKKWGKRVVVSHFDAGPMSTVLKKVHSCSALIINGRDYIVNAKAYEYLRLGRPVLGIYRRPTTTSRFMQEFPGYRMIRDYDSFHRACDELLGGQLVELGVTNVTRFSRTESNKILLSAIMAL